MGRTTQNGACDPKRTARFKMHRPMAAQTWILGVDAQHPIQSQSTEIHGRAPISTLGARFLVVRSI